MNDKQFNSDYLNKDKLIASLETEIQHLRKCLTDAGISYSTFSTDELHYSTERILDSGKRYRDILDQMQEGCAIIDFNWTYLYVNPAGAKHARFSVEKMIGKTIYEIIPKVEAISFYQTYKICMEQRIPQSIDTPFTFKNGEVRWFEAHAYPIPEGIFILSIDVTDHKVYEDKINAQKNLFEKFLELIPAGVFITDKNGDLIISNHEATNIWRGKPDVNEKDLRNYKASYTDSGKPIAPEEWASVRARKGEVILNEELLIQCFDGSTKNIYNSAVPVYKANAELEAVIIVNVDITPLKEKEKELLESQKSLSYALEEKEKLLIEINKALKEKELLLREIHHRVKNNMQVIQSLLNLQSGYFEDARVQEAFEVSRSRIKAMSIVHEQLYTTNRLSSIEFDKYLNELIDKIKLTYIPENLHVDFIVNCENLVISIDTALNMGLIINELVLNSIKHAFPDKPDGCINIDINKEDDIIRIIVADNGIGISEHIDLKKSKSFGLELINNLIEVSQCSLKVDRSNGTKTIITLPYQIAIKGIIEVSS